ncbi:MAG: hypothetical protein WDN45_01460 [Caulobacteraceae bacterium]
MQAFPNLTGKQAVQLLLQTADAEGTGGVNSTYGVGQLDIARAFQPVGAVQVAQTNGVSASVVGSPDAFVSNAVGDAIVRSQALTTVGRDSYNRPFKINLAQGYRPAGVSIISADRRTQWRSSDIDAPSFAGGRMRVMASVGFGAWTRPRSIIGCSPAPPTGS